MWRSIHSLPSCQIYLHSLRSCQIYLISWFETKCFNNNYAICHCRDVGVDINHVQNWNLQIYCDITWIREQKSVKNYGYCFRLSCCVQDIKRSIFAKTCLVACAAIDYRVIYTYYFEDKFSFLASITSAKRMIIIC